MPYAYSLFWGVLSRKWTGPDSASLGIELRTQSQTRNCQDPARTHIPTGPIRYSTVSLYHARLLNSGTRLRKQCLSIGQFVCKAK